jgi:hypothetical protein
MKICSVLSAALFTVLVTVGCSSPYATKLPTEVVSWDGDAKLQKALAGITEDERALLDRYSDRKAREGSVGTGGIAPGTTVYAALEDQREWEAEQERAEADLREVQVRQEAARQTKLDEMRAVATATVVELALEEASLSRSRLSDLFETKIQVQNLSDRPLARVRGTVIFRDLAGADLKSVMVVHSDGLSPHASDTFEAQLEYNTRAEGDLTLARTPLDQLVLAWDPNEIVFADGSRLDAE